MTPASDNRGFTLIELMIVVAIIGLLTAIALPSMYRMQARARQAEAKANLRGYFSAAKSIYAESGRFSCGMCDWAPERGHRYNYFLSNSVTVETGSEGCDQGSAALTAAEQSDSDPNINKVGGFTAGAAGNIDGDVACDGWNINDANDLWTPQDDAL